ncbi:MAG: tRNA pseudouridine(55) synthase TruB [Planctomycetes bacterium]|nr:tRNA pseudouridine(55) synthase TruB [Planctomycetota bacterium]
MFGILNINKPAGWTSRDVVNRVHRLVKPAKAGHAGTLDPLATGVLVVCIGPATRLISYVQEMQKQYQATFLLGRSSPSDDTETEIVELASPPIPTLDDIKARLPQFTGSIQQTPPIYSALKIGGKRAYHLARSGQQVELKPRTVQIYELVITAYEYPRLEMTIRCGSGTYVRSVGRDLAESLGTAAVMSGLTRTAIGHFQVQDGLSLDQLTQEEVAAKLQPARCAVDHLPTITLTPQQLEEIRNGRLIEVDTAALFDSPCSEIAALDNDGRLVALMQEKQPGILGPIRNFPSPP